VLLEVASLRANFAKLLDQGLVFNLLRRRKPSRRGSTAQFLPQSDCLALFQNGDDIPIVAVLAVQPGQSPCRRRDFSADRPAIRYVEERPLQVVQDSLPALCCLSAIACVYSFCPVVTGARDRPQGGPR